jgi:hypothetical protein
VCPHHLVPFRGVAHVAYVPGGRLHGFGRIARLVDAIGHRLTYQEWMTRDIAEALVLHGQAKGAACVIEAEQLCLLLGEDRRGDERVYTQAFAGVFNGAPFSCQSGISSVSARGSSTAPDRICAPTSEPFSSTQTEISRPFSAQMRCGDVMPMPSSICAAVASFTGSIHAHPVHIHD